MEKADIAALDFAPLPKSEMDHCPPVPRRGPDDAEPQTGISLFCRVLGSLEQKLSHNRG